MARKKPFGYDFIMSIPGSFLMISGLIMGFMFWWQSVQMQNLVGSEVSLRIRQVIDGDSFFANTEEGYLLRIRMRSVDAPEMGQPHGKESKLYLEKLLLAKNTDVVAYLYEKDLNAAYVADVFIQTGFSTEFTYVQRTLLLNGQVWHFGPHDTRVPFEELQKNASDAQIGLWAADEPPTSPWRWKRIQERSKESQRRSKDKKHNARGKKEKVGRNNFLDKRNKISGK
eukprot:TRINITY_DN6333_c0_g1_i1.p1 TRINITY_DN6333_c0_g1~~TRINITY_DN6333_c0_g1_i1.p1  ORF type:complete len:227 (+),score=34.12 TRINITY_DN6333_c0_g1_i1:60-740(+)